MNPSYSPSAEHPVSICSSADSVRKFVNQTAGLAFTIAEEKGFPGSERFLSRFHDPAPQAALLTVAPLISLFVGTEINPDRPAGEGLGRGNPAYPMRVATALSETKPLAPSLAVAVEGLVVAGFLAGYTVDYVGGNHASWRDVSVNRAWQNFADTVRITSQHLGNLPIEGRIIWDLLVFGALGYFTNTCQELRIFSGEEEGKRQEEAVASAVYCCMAGHTMWQVITTEMEIMPEHDRPLTDDCLVAAPDQMILAATAVARA